MALFFPFCFSNFCGLNDLVEWTVSQTLGKKISPPIAFSRVGYDTEKVLCTVGLWREGKKQKMEKERIK